MSCLVLYDMLSSPVIFYAKSCTVLLILFHDYTITPLPQTDMAYSRHCMPSHVHVIRWELLVWFPLLHLQTEPGIGDWKLLSFWNVMSSPCCFFPRIFRVPVGFLLVFVIVAEMLFSFGDYVYTGMLKSPRLESWGKRGSLLLLCYFLPLIGVSSSLSLMTRRVIKVILSSFFLYWLPERQMR